MLTLEMAGLCTCDWDIIKHRSSPSRGAHYSRSLGALAGWGGGAWMRMGLLFPVRKMCWNRESELGCRGPSPGCVTPRKEHFASVYLTFVTCNGGWKSTCLKGWL